jgi:hypothetical protein
MLSWVGYSYAREHLLYEYWSEVNDFALELYAYRTGIKVSEILVYNLIRNNNALPFGRFNFVL